MDPFAAVRIVIRVVPSARAGIVQSRNEPGIAEGIGDEGVGREDVRPVTAIGNAAIEIVVGETGRAGERGFDEWRAVESVPVKSSGGFLNAFAVAVVITLRK